MIKIFQYECKRLLWNKFFFGLLLVILFYGGQVLNSVTILGVSHTAPFSPWSFGDYLSRMIPLLWIGLILIIRKTMPLFRKVFKKYDALNNSVQENIKGMRVVKAYVREDYEKKKFNKAAEDVQADFTRAERILALNGPLMQFCVYAVMVFVMAFGSYVVITTRGLELDV